MTSIPAAIRRLTILLLISSGLIKQDLQIIDEDATEVQIEQVAQVLCSIDDELINKDSIPDRQISRISTLVKLDEFFAQLPADSPLNNCKVRFSKSLEYLIGVVSVSNENVCADEKISKIEEFHKKFLSETKEDKEERLASQPEQEISILLKYFFVHYTLEISAVCQKSLINNIEWNLNDKFKDVELIGDSHIDAMRRMISKMSMVFNPEGPVEDYDDVILIWQLVFGASSIDEESKIRLKVKDPSFVSDVKLKCSNKFEPIYGKLIMPIIRLANIGYSNTGEQFRRERAELKDNKLIRHWYSITQICETIKPIVFYQDGSLQPTECILISADEAKKLTEGPTESTAGSVKAAKSDGIIYEPNTNDLSKIDQLSSLESLENRSMVSIALIKTNEGVRYRQVKKITKRIGKNLIDYISSTSVFKLFVSRKAPISDSYVKEDIHEVLRDSTQDSESLDASIEDDDEEEIPDTLKESLEELLLRKGAIARRKGRKRRGDLSYEKQRMSQMDNYRHTKSMEDMIQGMSKVVNVLLRSRQIIIILGVIVVILGIAVVIG